jgi:hypothetical protein
MKPNLPRVTRPTLLLLALLATGCASVQKPVVYPSSAPAVASAAVQKTKLDRDIGECTRRADAAVGRNTLQEPKSATASAARPAQAGGIGFVGAAAAAVASGARNTWERARSAAAGGAAGVATKLLLEWNEGDAVCQEYVERCLESRGHDVLGWR